MGFLQDKVVIITGAAAGIGLATATAALDEGARVFGIDLAPAPTSLQENPNFEFLRADLTDHDCPKRAVQACIAAFGQRIDGLLNVAGIADNYGSADSVTDEVWDRCLAVNLTAPVKLMREVIPIMREAGKGSIVNTSSKAGLSGASSGVAYTASKHGLIGVTKNVAWRFKTEGIRCNAICPGAVATEMGMTGDFSLWDQAAMEAMRPIHAAHMDMGIGATIKAQEVAQTLLFLVSDLSRRVNGAVIPVDDAWSTI
uniref:Short-chain dehydrogenase/reductase SptC n=1 Tax=Aspergillus sp. TaxID=5065 RepID=A0A6J4CUK9_9EURO|nr:short-chain dehydrogenase/reductase SptC [Aspergillus sp.]